MIRKIEITEPFHQIMNMGGPFTGLLSIDGKEFEGRYISQDVVFDEMTRMFYVVRYSDKGYFQWQDYFKIQAISADNNHHFLSRKKFKSLCLSNAHNGTVAYYDCFCEGNKTTLKTMEFNERNFDAYSPGHAHL